MLTTYFFVKRALNLKKCHSFLMQFISQQIHLLSAKSVPRYLRSSAKLLPFKVIFLRVYTYFSGFKKDLNSLYIESFGLLFILLLQVCFAISVNRKTTDLMNSSSFPTPSVIHTRANPSENKRFLGWYPSLSYIYCIKVCLQFVTCLQ